MRARNTRAYAYARKTSPSPPYLLHVLPQSVAPLTTPQTILQTIHRNACSSRKKSIYRHVTTFFYREFPRFNPNRSLDSEQISLDCWADGWLWVWRRSGLRRERTSNKMPTRKWKMAGRHILGNILHNNGLMTDWGLGFIGAYIHRRWHRKVQQSFPSFLFHHLNIQLNWPQQISLKLRKCKLEM